MPACSSTFKSCAFQVEKLFDDEKRALGWKQFFIKTLTDNGAKKGRIPRNIMNGEILRASLAWAAITTIIIALDPVLRGERL